MKATYYELKTGSYQPPTAGQIASGELQGAVTTAFPFIDPNEGPNPNNPFVPFQPGQSAPTLMTGQPAGVQQGYLAGQQIGQIAWLSLGEYTGDTAGTPTLSASAGSGNGTLASEGAKINGADAVVDVNTPVTSGGMANSATAPKLATDLAISQSQDPLIGTTLPGANAPVKVTADASVSGQSFFDVNQTARPANVPNNNQPTLISSLVEPGDPNGTYGEAHAEIGVIQQAYDAGLTKGQSMTIVVRGQNACSFCQSDLVKMADASGLNQLTVVNGADGSVLQWTRGGTKLEEIAPPKL